MVSKRKPTTPKKRDGHPRIFFFSHNLCFIFCKSILYRVFLTISLFFALYLWLSSTFIISSRKLNDPSVVLKKYGEIISQKNDTFVRTIVSGEDRKRYGVNAKSVLDHKAKNESEEEQYKYIKPKSEGEGYALRAVIKYIHVQRSWLSTRKKGENPGSCEGKGVYVYDLPSKFNRDLLVECKDMVPWTNMCKFFKNEGFGEAIGNLGQRWFRTHQYALEPIFHSRVLKHPCRVYNESQAKIFYVPFYAGFDVLRWHFKNNVSDVMKDRLGIEVLKWLESKESWKRNAGKDHVFVLGKISWDFRRSKLPWGSRFLELQGMKNPTKLLIERHPWEVNDIAIPHPTYFHPKTDNDIASWQVKMMNKPRRNVVSFAGGARPGNPHSIRSTLIEQCTTLADQCRFLNCSNGSCDKPENVIELFQDSEFCLQPSGDSPTRKSVFDSLISGCIPVIFNPYTAYYQYAWHLPEDHRKYSVYISQEDVEGKRVNVVKKLMAKTLSEKEEMRSYIIHQLLPGLVYGDSNAKFHRFRDAFDITFDSLLEKINRLV
ncbi:PREDICTED: probable xyloglucan galactosyltransferase GT20 [Camelina sativa]|uniref:Probable xyloglucan galactosyltransferase GT20 n=1 Tax=Camelina sativa TaxID=90675 RepID=A0ABM0U6W1_CAMSA|nr:PREDICTED: probable xyloglucan galactosyltransferase GT20 [Camelina sativa]